MIAPTAASVFAAALLSLSSPDHGQREWGSRHLKWGTWEQVYKHSRHHPDPEVRRRCHADHARRSARFVSDLYPLGPGAGPLLSRSVAWYTVPEPVLDRIAFDAVIVSYPTEGYIDPGVYLTGMRHNLYGFYAIQWGWGLNGVMPGYSPRYPLADPLALYTWITREVHARGPAAVLRVLGAYYSAVFRGVHTEPTYYPEDMP